MKLVTLASGSSGNCTLIECGETRLLVDAGISLKRIRLALGERGIALETLSGVLVTHEHEDHIRALPMLCKYTALPVFAPPTVGRALLGRCPQLEDRLRPVRKGEPFSIENLTVTAFSTPHDTPESVGYRVESAEGSLGVCTDTGTVTEEMLSSLEGCAAVLIEANHDLDMLRFGPYPVALKRRILSTRGHLSNEDCAAFACALAAAGTGSIVLGHLSRENNTPRRALETVGEALSAAGFGDVALAVAPESGSLAIEVVPCSVSS